MVYCNYISNLDHEDHESFGRQWVEEISTFVKKRPNVKEFRFRTGRGVLDTSDYNFSQYLREGFRTRRPHDMAFEHGSRPAALSFSGDDGCNRIVTLIITSVYEDI